MIWKGKPQKRYFFSGPANKRGGGKGLATKKKITFFEALKKSQKNVAIKLEVGKALAGPLKK